MPAPGWKQLLDGYPWFDGAGAFPITAYSEFMPPPRFGRKPYGTFSGLPFDEADPWGMPVTEYEQAWELRPGLDRVAREVVGALANLCRGKRTRGVAQHKLVNNPCWTAELGDSAGALDHERFVVFMPLALSRTQDEKGRVRWTLFGASEQGPARAFWKSFFTAPGRPTSAAHGPDFIRRLLATVYGQTVDRLEDLHGAGFRILPRGNDPDYPHWSEEPLPAWTRPFLWTGAGSAARVKYLLTFRPFQSLPVAVRREYLAGRLHLLPCPASLLFWSVPCYRKLDHDLPLAVQIPLLSFFDRREHPYDIRIPQAGWLHEPRPGESAAPPRDRHIRQTYKRTHRWDRVRRDQDTLEVLDSEDKVAHVLFSTAPNDLGLYGKPMARNAQVWTHDFKRLLDGPRATSDELHHAAEVLAAGGLFGYRFLFPPMRVGRHELTWHRPLVAYLPARSATSAVLPDAPLGYVTAYRADRPNLARPIELWPRLLRREAHLANLDLFGGDQPPHWTARNVRKIFETSKILGDRPLPTTFARELIHCPKHEMLDDWLDALPGRSSDVERAGWLVTELCRTVDFQSTNKRNAKRPRPLTLHRTARRSFEIAYWNTIAALAHGEFRNKENADCVLDPVTQATLEHHQRDLEALGDYLIAYYTDAIGRARVKDAWAGEHAFTWRTDFRYPWWGGWLHNQEGRTYERNIVARIPGKDRTRAVIMADHYDTAYTHDHFEEARGGNGARIAAPGADDNHSATAALMLAAPIFLELSKAGRLGCDIWLVHLTGEEFPSDCMGARHLSQALVERSFKVRTADGAVRDLSGVRVQGVYVSDMIAHNNEHDRNVFQIAPGQGPESTWLAYQAHLATRLWNDLARLRNRRPPRRGAGPGRRSADARTLPALAEFPDLRGEVRPPFDPRSTLYNTDGQVFSDAGVPVVLFMENYDINRIGYHDMEDSLANIDLDYGSAVTAIVIEAVARAATEDPRSFLR
jgi:hypothetical protein